MRLKRSPTSSLIIISKILITFFTELHRKYHLFFRRSFFPLPDSFLLHYTSPIPGKQQVTFRYCSLSSETLAVSLRKKVIQV
jgi:hypothetical protein